MVSEKLQKVLAKSGLGARRKMESWIEAGLVTVNGKKACLGLRVSPEDQIVVNGKPIAWPREDKPALLLYHKPCGELVTRHDPCGRKTIFARLPKDKRWIAVGRLDINSSGLLLLTSSGDLANHLMHPRFGMEREYLARVHPPLSMEDIMKIKKGVQLEDGLALVRSIQLEQTKESNAWYRVVLSEGRNREVRRIFAHFNRQVSRLIRLRYGPFHLPENLKEGAYVTLADETLAAFLEQIGYGAHV
jgi:23S rRNA pseudouridine2605 synthase